MSFHAVRFASRLASSSHASMSIKPREMLPDDRLPHGIYSDLDELKRSYAAIASRPTKLSSFSEEDWPAISAPRKRPHSRLTPISSPSGSPAMRRGPPSLRPPSSPQRLAGTRASSYSPPMTRAPSFERAFTRRKLPPMASSPSLGARPPSRLSEQTQSSLQRAAQEYQLKEVILSREFSHARAFPAGVALVGKSGGFGLSGLTIIGSRDTSPATSRLVGSRSTSSLPIRLAGQDSPEDSPRSSGPVDAECLVEATGQEPN